MNIIKAKKILNKSHYGLDKVKARVVEYLVARKNSEKVGTQILCLTGAPGTGKTTICKSIAEAINKPFVKVALGGVSDESILFGSDSVYIGSHAGRILKAVKSTGVNNCLLMLDEIDKVFNNGTQSGGNINARLLELLDPSQNKTFVDHYLDLEFDMSKIMFVCTANYLDQIPAALKDRLEIIHIEQYTPEEKQHIAEKYLIPAALKEYNLHKLEISFTKDAVTYIVEKFTHEAGVRELNQKIHSICRKFLVERDEGQIFTCKVTQELVDKYLTEKEKYEKYKVAEKPQIGVCNCLYYSEAGGGSEPISCTLFKGTGKLVLSGQVGKAEEHACNIALGYIKSNVRKFGLSKIDFKKIDIQLTTSQVPDNPSDGSSAT
ncbi:hypothetical protein FACS1894166_11480 [Bacilli bacterium]|nr:hypothetical protein FACS1894166_11480 [Bacilli bacterium]